MISVASEQGKGWLPGQSACPDRKLDWSDGYAGIHVVMDFG